MKKKIKNIIILVVVITLFLGMRFPSTKTLSLDEIKTRIKDTEKIYVCPGRDSRDASCSKSERISTLKDIEKINTLVAALQNIEENENSAKTGGEYYTIYFMNRDDKVVACANYAGNIVFRTWKKEYVMDVKEIEKLNLKDLLGTKV